eukprot:m.230340 g.230340  ORF g.230340 m.230340 type:complete len:154 (+) comp26024_c0_seq5:2729-3190(+)
MLLVTDAWASRLWAGRARTAAPMAVMHRVQFGSDWQRTMSTTHRGIVGGAEGPADPPPPPLLSGEGAAVVGVDVALGTGPPSETAWLVEGAVPVTPAAASLRSAAAPLAPHEATHAHTARVAARAGRPAQRRRSRHLGALRVIVTVSKGSAAP